MRYTLKDYQEDAIRDVLRNLEHAREDWHRRGRAVGFSLTATTGAGKTVMAAAVIEALFDGNADYDFEPDPGAVVLWFTDDPSLNEQTRFRLLDAADRLAHSRLVVIENTFNQERLERGKVYFLNAQKLGKNSLLVRGAPDDDSKPYLLPPPDGRAFTMWDTISNTINAEDLTLYLILDEAHRGMRSEGAARAERATIVQRLVNGGPNAPAAPIVWGISATVQRFNDAMGKALNRTMYPSVIVDPARVQESGLLKDDIRLDFPSEAGKFDTVLLARATRKVREATASWSAYAQSQGSAAEPVVPLLVVQMPNRPSNDLLLSAFQTVREHWPELEPDAMAHVFGEHTAIELGGFLVPYVRPETVQDRTHIRVLFAKDAISTGWDCPRAEVLISFRPAQDETHITQLLGRMVRTPLARRIPGNDALNSVDCVLPLFNRKTAAEVAKTMLGGRDTDDDGTGGGAGRRVLMAPVEMQPNADIPEIVWQAFDALPSQTVPRKAARPIRRLAALAQALARDELRRDALKEAYRKLFAVLDGLVAMHRESIESGRRSILVVRGETIVGRVGGGDIAEGGRFTEQADDRSVEADFRAAGRVLSPELARRYADHVARPADGDDGLFDAHVLVAALARIQGVAEELDRAAAKIADAWLTECRVAIKGLPDDRRAVYEDIRGMSAEPQTTDLMRPRLRVEETQDADGNPVATRTRHLMSDESGLFPISALNNWETAVLDTEMQRPDFLAWYRNPSRASGDALAIAYQDAQGRWRRMCPDFVFFHGPTNDVKVSIVDPHGHHLGDALPKLRGLAAFAEAHGAAFHRIESITKMDDGTLRVLDLTEARVRLAVASADDAKGLYSGSAGSAYRPAVS